MRRKVFHLYVGVASLLVAHGTSTVIFMRECDCAKGAPLVEGGIMGLCARLPHKNILYEVLGQDMSCICFARGTNLPTLGVGQKDLVNSFSIPENLEGKSCLL